MWCGTLKRKHIFRNGDAYFWFARTAYTTLYQSMYYSIHITCPGKINYRINKLSEEIEKKLYNIMK